MRGRSQHCLLALTVLATAACVDGQPHYTFQNVRNRIAAETNPEHLLRPRQVVRVSPDSWVIAEEGRHTLTWLNDRGEITDRRWVGLQDLPSSYRVSAGTEWGRSLARASDGTWLLAEGVGPIFVPDRTVRGELPIQVYGSGQGGTEPQPGGQVDRSDFSQITALTTDQTGQLFLATADRVFEVGQTLSLVAGSGTSTPPDTELASDYPLVDIQALAFGSDGDLYLADAHSGLVFVVTASGEIEEVAGGGDRLSLPVEAIPADQAVLDLKGATMTWDASTGELLVAAGDRIALIDPSQTTIRSLAGVPRSVGGAATFTSGYLVTTLAGTLRLIAEDGTSTLIDTPDTDDSLAWGNAIERVGIDSLLVRDPAHSLWSIHVRGFGLFPLIESGSASQAPSRLLVANDAAQVYYSTPSDFRHLELNVGFRTLARSSPPPVFEGQSVTQYMLPMIGDLANDEQGQLLIVDACRRLLLRVDPTDGRLEQIAGVVNGGVLPSATYQPLASVARLDNPRLVWAAGDQIIVADVRLGAVALVALNATEEDQLVFGTSLSAGRAGVVGGLGQQTYEPGVLLSDLSLETLTAAVPLGQELVLATTVADQPTMVRVDSDGVVSDLFGSPSEAPSALLEVTNGVLAIGYPDSGEIELLNLNDTEKEAIGTTLLPGVLTSLSSVGAGVRDLAIANNTVVALTINGAVVALDPEPAALGEAGPTASSLAASPDGGLLVLVDGGFWGLDLSGEGRFLSEPLPNSLSEVISNKEGWTDGFPITSLPFGNNVTGLALNEDGDLFFTDRDLQALIKVEADEGRIGPLSQTSLIARGDPIPMTTDTVALQIDQTGQIYMLSHSRVYRFDGDGWDVAVGGGDEAPALGALGSDVDLHDIVGMEWDGQHLFLRSREGLLMFDSEDTVVRLWSSAAIRVPDPTLMRDVQGLAIVDGTPTFVFSGGVVELAEWP